VDGGGSEERRGGCEGDGGEEEGVAGEVAGYGEGLGCVNEYVRRRGYDEERGFNTMIPLEDIWSTCILSVST
jgi:hypothetical protein